MCVSMAQCGYHMLIYREGRLINYYLVMQFNYIAHYLFKQKLARKVTDNYTNIILIILKIKREIW